MHDGIEDEHIAVLQHAHAESHQETLVEAVLGEGPSSCTQHPEVPPDDVLREVGEGTGHSVTAR